jgi:two-component system, cell cycle sensor histidine kinase and response regulator CckA
LKQTEDDVRTTNAQWQTLVAMSAGAVLVFQDELLALANPSAVRLLGAASEADLKGRRATDFLHEDDRRAIAARARLGLQPQENPQPLLRQKMRRVDGSMVETEMSSLRFQFRGRAALLVEARDIGDRKRVESRLLLQHAVTAALGEASSPSKINQKVLAMLCCGFQWNFGEWWTADRSAHVLRCTDTWHLPSNEFLRFAAESRTLVFATGQGLPGRVWASGRAEWCADVSLDAAGPRHDQACRMNLRGWIGFPIKLRQEVVGVVGFFSGQVTRPDAALLAFFDTVGLQLGQFMERQQLANQFREAQKRATLGTLAEGIAHDFNNILVAIHGHCALAREATGHATLTQHLDGLMSGAHRATALVQQIVAFSRQEAPQRRSIQLWDIATEAMQLLRAAVPAMIEFQVALGKDAPVVLGDATQIHQILMNLGANAAHAMREQGGRLMVTLENCLVGPNVAATHPDLHVGRYARLTVRDTGHGMDAQTLERIFEPFFTTKPPGEGSGLGLAVVHGIVKSHEGAITVSSRRGEGATFQVYFPAHLIAADTA